MPCSADTKLRGHLRYSIPWSARSRNDSGIVAERLGGFEIHD
jgi:hypothetical protein